MSQQENLNLLLKLHNVITGTDSTVEEIVSRRTVEPDISLIYNSELGGKVAFGNKISVDKYYTLGELLEPESSATDR